MSRALSWSQVLTVASVFTYGLSNGGPAGLVYGYIFCFIGTLAVVASLAELMARWHR